jgi:hypothetical protein
MKSASTFYDMSKGTYNLAHIVSIRHIGGEVKDGYFYRSQPVEKKTAFFGLFTTQEYRPVGYYSYDWYGGHAVLSTKERATYGEGVLEVTFTGDDTCREWDFETKEKALEFIEHVKSVNTGCKYEFPAT